MTSVLRKWRSFRLHWQAHGTRGAIELLRARIGRPRGTASRRAGPTTPQLLLDKRFPDLRRFPTYLPPADKGRINVVTDSVGKDSLFGGVATAVIIAAIAARETGRRLRLITRRDPPDAAPLRRILAANAIAFPGSIELAHAPLEKARSIDVGPSDRFLSTSWWTTRATVDSVGTARTVYLLQEDERGFYPLGDDQLRAEQTMRDPALRFLVNSELLYRHLIAEGFENIARQGIFFEPAFSRSLFFPAPRTGRLRLGFYARPNNSRNLFWLGLEVLKQAIREGLFSPKEWEFVFFGKDVPTDLVFDNGIQVSVVDRVPIEEYAAAIRTLDVGLALMATPHPSYPPLDLAASGCAVVTNKLGLKTSLANYSEDIVTSELSVEGLVESLRIAARQAPARRQSGSLARPSGIADSWEASLRGVTRFLTEAWSDVPR